MARPIRTFIALRVGARPARALAAAAQALQDASPQLRTPAARDLHITLHFLGNTLEQDIMPIQRALAQLAPSHAPLAVRYLGLGAFPTPDRARVVFAGVVAARAGAGGDDEAAFEDPDPYEEDDDIQDDDIQDDDQEGGGDEGDDAAGVSGKPSPAERSSLAAEPLRSGVPTQPLAPGDGPLERLAAHIQRAMAALGYPSQERRFHPHVTLGRLHGPPTPALVDLLRTPALNYGEEILSELKLILSAPEERPYHYIDLTTVQLGRGG